MPARTSWEEAAAGGHQDHDRGTRYEGLVHELPRLRTSPLGRLARSGRGGLPPVAEPSPAAARCIRRNARRQEKEHRHPGPARRPTCYRGHGMTPENIYQPPDRGIQCRACRNASYRARRRGVSVDQLLATEAA